MAKLKDDGLKSFSPYDDVEITFEKSNFSVDESARSQAVDNKPDSEDTDFDEPQTTIRNGYRHRHISEKERTSKYLGWAKARIDETRTRVLSLDVETLLNKFRTTLMVHRSNAGNDLKQLSISKYRELRNLNYFKSRNNLKEIARYPESGILHYSIVALVVVSESIANAYFFAQGNDLGLLGGYLQASLISVVNVGSALLLGTFCLRNLNHVQVVRKVLSFLTLLLYIAFSILFNLGAAHYRDLISLNPLAPATDALDPLLNDPFALTFDGYMLFFIGIGVAILAAVKAYSADDTYPQYGKMDRAHKKAETHLEAQKKTSKKELETLAQEALNGVDENLQQAKLGRDRCGQDASHIKNARTAFKDTTGKINNQYIEKIKRYRKINKGIRTSREPVYFGIYKPEFSDSLENFEWIEQLDTIKRELVKSVRDAESKMAAVKKEITDQLQEELDNLDAVIEQIDRDIPRELE